MVNGKVSTFTEEHKAMLKQALADMSDNFIHS